MTSIGPKAFLTARMTTDAMLSSGQPGSRLFPSPQPLLSLFGRKPSALRPRKRIAPTIRVPNGGLAFQLAVPSGDRARSGRRPLDAAVEFVAAVRPALIPFTDRIGRQLGVGGERLGAVLLGAALRPVAETEGRAVVPPCAGIVRGAVENLVADVRVLEPDADELYEVLGLQPDRQPALVGGRIGDIADAQAGGAQPVLEGVERRERFAEGLAGAVAGVGPDRRFDADATLARIEADRMVRRREHDPLGPAAARGLEQVVAADDIGVEDSLPRPFDRKAAEMDDALHPVHRALDLAHDGKIGFHEDLVRREIGRRIKVAPADVGVDALEQLAQPSADAARCASDQYRLHDASAANAECSLCSVAFSSANRLPPRIRSGAGFRQKMRQRVTSCRASPQTSDSGGGC